jgi:hypothetical protein
MIQSTAPRFSQASAMRIQRDSTALKSPVHLQSSAKAEVHFSGVDGKAIGDAVSFLFKAAIVSVGALVLGGVAAGGYLINGAVQQSRFENKEPVCSQAIPSYSTFNQIVEKAGGRQNIECSPTGFSTKK